MMMGISEVALNSRHSWMPSTSPGNPMSRMTGLGRYCLIRSSPVAPSAALYTR